MATKRPTLGPDSGSASDDDAPSGARTPAWLSDVAAWATPGALRAVEGVRAAARRASPGPDPRAAPLAEVRPVQIPVDPDAPEIPDAPKAGAGARAWRAGRLYVPLGAGVGPGPGLVFFHGGGFVIGDLDSHDGLCRRFAAASHMRVLAVDYRLAPTYRFPAAYDDALAAFDWVRGPGAAALSMDPARLAVGGDSAGGNLAAGVSQARRGDVAAQLLLYPWLQLVETNASRLKLLEGHMLATGVIEAARASYLPHVRDAHDVRASPLLAEDLAGVAPAYVVTCGLDPLNPEGRAYVERLRASGVHADLVHCERMPHGFMQYPGVFKNAEDEIHAAARAMSALSRQEPRS